jgi:hypothetical protein
MTHRGNGSNGMLGAEPPDDDGEEEEEEELNSTGPDGMSNGVSGGRPSGPIGPADLGLPSEYDPRYIPSSEDLQRAAQYALDNYTAFLILHQDDPKAVAAQLDQIADVVRASSQITGDHQSKAIRLGLALESEYWMARNAVQDWIHLIIPMLQTALIIEDQELQVRVYRALGHYLFFIRDDVRANTALRIALEYAEQTNQADLMLLARVERFVFAIRDVKKSIEDILAEANAILADAARLKFRYVQGRAHYILSLVYQRATLSDVAFAHAQQAYIYLAATEANGLAVEALSAMLSSLNMFNHCSERYKERLFEHIDRLVSQSGNPWYRAMALLLQATQSFHSSDHDNARWCALKSWGEFKALGDFHNCMSARHMLGLIQTKRCQWLLAEKHLQAAYNWYRKAHNDIWAVNAYHALAFIPVEQHNIGRAEVMLRESLAMARELPASEARENLVSVIEEDLRKLLGQVESS